MLLLCMPFLWLSTHLYTKEALFCLLKLLRGTPGSPPLFCLEVWQTFQDRQVQIWTCEPPALLPCPDLFSGPIFNRRQFQPRGCQTRGFGVILDSPVAQMVKNLPTMQETWVQCLGWEDPRRKERLHTPAHLPGKSHGQRSLTGYSPWGHKELDTT